MARNAVEHVRRIVRDTLESGDIVDAGRVARQAARWLPSWDHKKIVDLIITEVAIAGGAVLIDGSRELASTGKSSPAVPRRSDWQIGPGGEQYR